MLVVSGLHEGTSGTVGASLNFGLWRPRGNTRRQSAGRRTRSSISSASTTFLSLLANMSFKKRFVTTVNKWLHKFKLALCSSKLDLLVRVRYSNPLPAPPCPPKLLDVPTDPMRYARPEFLNDIASDTPLPMIVDAECGMPLDLGKWECLWEPDADDSGTCYVSFPMTAAADSVITLT